MVIFVYFQVDDLSRMYRLYHKILRGLEPVANIFKQVYYLSSFFCL